MRPFFLLAFALVVANFQAAQASEARKLATPKTGMYHGAFPDFCGSEEHVTKAAIREYEELAGPDVVWAYFSNNWWRRIRFPAEEVETILSANRLPFIRIMPRASWKEEDPTYKLDKILDREFETDIRTWFRVAAKVPSPLLVEFGTEANLDDFPWSGYANGAGKKSYCDPDLHDGPERVVQAFRYLVNLSREEGAHNITWFAHLNCTSFPDKKWNTLKHYYPGDDWADWVGLSCYGLQGAESAEDPWIPAEEWAEILRDSVSEIASLTSRPIALLEFGVNERMRIQPGQQTKADWIRDAFAALKNDPDLQAHIKAISWWHDNDTQSELRIDTSQETLENFVKGLAQLPLGELEWNEVVHHPEAPPTCP